MRSEIHPRRGARRFGRLLMLPIVLVASLSGCELGSEELSGLDEEILAELARLVVSPSTGDLLVGESLQFAVVARDEDGNSLELPEGLEWASSDPDVAVVNAMGMAQAVGDGADDRSACQRVGGTPLNRQQLRVARGGMRGQTDVARAARRIVGIHDALP